jgi:heterotetrameric sarcosine oxidase gamma subunit
VKLQLRTVFGATCATRSPVPGFIGNDTHLTERADIGCLLVNSAVESTVVASTLAIVAGFAFPLTAGAIVDAHPHRVLWLTPRSWLVHCSIDQELVVATRINNAFLDKSVHASLFTDHLCWFELCGPRSRGLLLEGGFVSLEREGLGCGFAKRTILGGVAAVVLHEREQVWLLGIERSRAIYISDWLRRAIEQSVS